MKNNIKKVLSFIVILALTLFTFACNKLEPKNNANVSDPNSVYISITENSIKYEVLKGRMYSELKSTVGYNTLFDLMVTDVLKAEKVYETITDEEVIEAIDEAIYGSKDVDELEDDEQQELIDTFLDTMFKDYGYTGDDVYSDSVKEVYKLNLAKKAYALKKLEEEIVEHNENYQAWVDAGKDEEDEDAVKEPYFTEDDFETEYSSNNKGEYWAIIIPFTSYREYVIALQQLNLTIENGEWKRNDVKLTDEQVASVFIELYNQLYGYKLDADADLSLTNLTEDSAFYYTYSQLKSYNATLATHIQDIYGSYNKDEENCYSKEVEVLNSGKIYALVLKLGEDIKADYADLSETEKEKVDAESLVELKNDLLTTNYISRKIYALLAEKNLVIYDSTLSAAHTSAIANYGVEYTATDEESDVNVAKTDVATYTADQLFNLMDKRAGMVTALSELVYQRFLNNSSINKFYNTSNGTWLDDDVKEDIEDQINTEKANFENGNYIDYGYDPELMTWEDFISGVYSANSEDELMLLFLYGEIVSDFTESLLDITKKEDNKYIESTVWPLIQAKMEADFAEYFNVKGIHLLICIYKDPLGEINNSGTINPEEWTEEQKELAKKLFAEVNSYVAASKGSYQARLKEIQEAFSNCPTTSGEATFNGVNVKTTLTSADDSVTINIAEYKSKGITVKYEDLGSFKNGKMVESFDEAVKSIWDKDMEDEVTDRKTVCTEIIETEYGYHYYINLESTKAPSYSTTVNDEKKSFNVPRIDEIREYLEDEDNVNSDTKSLITTYYTPVVTEISGSYLTYVLQYQGILDIIDSVNVTSSKYSKDDLVRMLNLEINDWFENNLSYITKDDLKYFK